MKNLFRTWLILPLLALIISPSFGQKQTVVKDAPTSMPNGLTVKNNMLYFDNMDAMLETYDYLAYQVSNTKQVESTKAESSDIMQHLINENNADPLTQFENKLGLKNTLRQSNFNQKLALTTQALKSKDGSKSAVGFDADDMVDQGYEGEDLMFRDEILQTILTPNRAFGLGADIMVYISENRAYRVANSNMETYEKLMNGMDPRFNVMPDLTEEFFVEGGGTSAKGDGDDWWDVIFDWAKKCHVWIKKVENPDGTVCFTAIPWSLGGDTNIVTYDWTINGTHYSTEQVCSTFECDKWQWVKLSITTTTGCKAKANLPFRITSKHCCAASFTNKDTYYYDNNKRKIKLKQHQINFFPIHRIRFSMINKKKGWGGFWFKKKANMKINASGNVYFKDQYKCWCEVQQSFSVASSGYVKTLDKVYNPGSYFKMKISNPWSGRYYKDNNLIKTMIATDNCD